MYLFTLTTHNTFNANVEMSHHLETDYIFCGRVQMRTMSYLT